MLFLVPQLVSSSSLRSTPATLLLSASAFSVRAGWMEKADWMMLAET